MTWPIKLNFCQGERLGDVARTAHASAHTKSLYSEISASLPYDCDYLYLMITSYVNKEFLIDIAIGADGSEVIILSNLFHSGTGSVTYNAQLFIQNIIPIPIHLKAGTRLAVRVQCNTGSQQINIAAFSLRKSYYSDACIAGIDTIGAVTSDTGGTAIADCGGVAMTYSAWTQMVASSARAYKGFFVGWGLRAIYPTATGAFYIDVGVGAEGSEVSIATKLYFMSSGYAGPIDKESPLIFTSIPAGTRISIRYMSTETNYRNIDCVFYGLF